MNQPRLFKTRALVSVALFFVAVLSFFSARASAQQREHLTPEEVELVRDNQELDKRTDVFVHAAERRLLAVTNPEEAAKQQAKEKEKWGEVKGTRAELLYDISKILEEAVTNVDDAAQHNPESALLRKSLYKLSEAAGRIAPQLARLREGTQQESEADQLDRAIETAQEILDAAKQRAVTAEDLKTKDPKAKDGKKGN
jgi:sugar diacid utilization regulator